MKIPSWKRACCTALAAVLVWSAAASAHDGYYLGLEGGINFASKEKFKFHQGNGQLGANLDGQTIGSKDFKDGWVAGVLAGYAFENGFRPELEYAFRRDKFDKGDALQGLQLSNQPEQDLKGKQDTQSGFVNLWYDLLKGSDFHPYLGGGAGYGNVHIKRPDYDGAPDTLHGDDDDAFMWQAGAGLGYDVSEHFMAALDYRYVKSDQVRFDLVEGGSGHTTTHYEASSVLLSVLYFFGGKDAPAAPAPVEPVAVVPPVEPPPPPPPPPICSDGLDNDGDGLIDYPADKGCTSPDDGDETDPCASPGSGERVSLQGCGKGDVIVLRGVNFDFDKATLTPNAKSILDNVSEELAKYPAVTVEVGGHTDGKGSDEYNQALSDRRSKSVVTYLKGKGVDGSRMTAKGYGESQPIADNATDAGRELNRRVELRITGGVAGASAAAPIAQGTEVAPLAGPAAASEPAAEPSSVAPPPAPKAKRKAKPAPPPDDEDEDPAS